MIKFILKTASIFLISAPVFLVCAQTEMPTAATSCVACHGQNGISANELWPNLKGQKKDYLAKQLRAFKTGDRKDPMMTAMVAPLSEADITTIADYFSKMTDTKKQ